MGKRFRGTAQAPIAFGQNVLCRDFRIWPAERNVANGIARALPAWTRQHSYETGDHLVADEIEGLGERDLQALADGPIMEPTRIYLPAGRISEAEYQQRLDLQFRDAGIDA